MRRAEPWLAVLLIMATADALEPKLRLFLERRVSAALTGVGSGRIDNVAIHERVPALVDGLAADLDGRSSAAADALNPADLKKRSARVHKVAVQAALAIENDPALRVACANGEVGLLQLAEAQLQRRRAAVHMYNVINGHHREMRKVAKTAIEGPGSSAAGVRDDGGSSSGSSDGGIAPASGAASAAPTAADDAEAWRHATADESSLREYAAAATQIGTRAWVRAGIDWTVEQANGFFREGGSARLTKREVLGYSYATSGGPPDGPTVEWLMCAAAAEGGRAPTEPLRLLDVGSCGTLFDARYDALACTALDLCPQDGNGHVLQCDFLQLGIGPSDGAPVIEPHERFPAGRLTSLPAASFDVVVLSLVLSYLPIPRQRHAMILKARQLLPTPDACSTQLTAAAQAAAQAAMDAADPATSSGVSRGENSGVSRGGISGVTRGGISGVRWRRGLLLIVDTYSVDRRARSWRDQTRLREWAAAIESAGFVFLRHVTLQRSHALAFATAPMSDAELAALATREPMEMHMKREQRAQGWEAGMGHGASWAAGTDLD
jgi:hypothetical protein